MRTHWARVVARYEEAAMPEGAPVHSLTMPTPGSVGVASDGLYFAFSHEGRSVSPFVPWMAVQHMHASGTDGLCVIVEQVGDLILPARASHDVWQHANEAYRQSVNHGGGADHTATESESVA